MNGRLLAQVAWVFLRDAEALEGYPYAWPPKPVAPETRAEADRLHAIARELFDRAAAAGQDKNGTDYVFGESSSSAA